MVDAAKQIDPNGVSLSDNLTMVHIAHARLHVVLNTLVVQVHPAAHIVDTFGQVLMEWDMDMEEYYPKYWWINTNIPALLAHWVQICLS